MKAINWNADKNQELISRRGIAFEDVAFHVKEGDILDEFPHPNQEKYPDQRVFAVSIDDYVYLVPYIESSKELFLKTIIPSRKATKQYLGERP